MAAAVGLAALIVALAAVVVFHGELRHGSDAEIVQKREWSVLQGLEVQHRDAQDQGVLVVPRALGTEYTALGIPLANRPPDMRGCLLIRRASQTLKFCRSDLNLDSPATISLGYKQQSN
jgi:hypothetical protein